jgi:hypothetical protein
VSIEIGRSGIGTAVRGEILFGGLTTADWDRLADQHFYSSSAWLQFCATKGGGVPGAAVIHGDTAPAVAVPVLGLTEPPAPLYRWSDILADRELPIPPAAGLLVGPRQGYLTNLLTGPGGVTPEAAASLIDAVRGWPLDAATQGQDHARVAMYVTTADAELLRAGGADAEPVLLEADAMFELPPGGWDGYLDSLPSKRRGNIRREVREFVSAGYRIEHVPLADCYTELPELAEATQSKYGHGAPTDFWLNLLRGHVMSMGAAAQVGLCRRASGEIVGFGLYYVWADTLYLRWAGFDYRRLDGAAEYFNLVYYDHIQRACALGIRRIHAGIKASQAKWLRSARLRPLWLVDLSSDSVLSGHRNEVRQHNRSRYQQLICELGQPPTVDPAEWMAFS